MNSSDRSREFEKIFDDLTYELSSARAAGLERPDEARAALKRARDLIADADTLAAIVLAQQSEAPGD